MHHASTSGEIVEERPATNRVGNGGLPRPGPTARTSGGQNRSSMLSNVLSGPFRLGHRLVRNNVIDVRVVCVNRLRRLPIATIKQRACSRSSRGSWRFWIAHYYRKRFDRF